MSRTYSMPRMRSYADAVGVLNGRSSRKIANNTYLERLDEHTIGVRLHSTHVVKYVSTDAGDVVILDHGGYPTRTTKDRIDSCLPDGWYLDGSTMSGYYIDGDEHQSIYYNRQRGGTPKKWRPWVITKGLPWGDHTVIAYFHPGIAIPVKTADTFAAA